MQLVELCYWIADVIDSIQANMHQYTKYDYVQNGYYPLIKYSIHILCEIRGWLLSSQKAIWRMTIRFFGGCPLTLILTKDEDQSTEYIGVSPPLNRFVLASRYFVLWERLALYPPTTSGSYCREGGRQAGRRNTGGFQNFRTSLQVKPFGLLFCLISLQFYCSIRTAFGRLLSS